MREIHWFESVGSTMHEAARLAREGCPHGTVVGADQQTAGQGRLGRSWHSEKGAGLYVSIVLRLPETAVPFVTLALGLAAGEAISKSSGAACDLRWTNDVLIGTRKVAGILTEKHDDAVIAGVGINLNQSSFPDQLSAIAISMAQASGRGFEARAVLDTLLAAIDRYLALLISEGKRPILELFTARSSYVRGKRVVVENGGQELVGVTDGIDPSGFLWLRTAAGERTLILAGSVRPA